MKMTLICLPFPDASLAKTSGKESPKGEMAPRVRPPILKNSRRFIDLTLARNGSCSNPNFQVGENWLPKRQYDRPCPCIPIPNHPNCLACPPCNLSCNHWVDLPSSGMKSNFLVIPILAVAVLTTDSFSEETAITESYEN